MSTRMNPEQLQVVELEPGPLLVAATAGSGKTHALTQRIAHLINGGADPARILAVTFSSKAAREMTTRLRRIGCLDGRVGTFHSIALQVVRTELPGIAGWSIDDTDRYRVCVKDAVGYRYMNWNVADVTHLLSFIGRCKAVGAFPVPDDLKALAIATELYRKRPHSSRDPKRCCEAYVTAELIRRERALLTFDDMLFEAWNLFREDDGIRESWASRWDHVLQDEVQDENLLQRELASFLAQDHRSYTVVGDPAQSIYKFRGSDPSGMLRFETEWSATVVRMGRNYRCAKRIVEVANRVLRAMPAGTHLGVEMVAERVEEGEVSSVWYEDFDDEGEGVTECILESHEDGRDWSHHVVLYRTNAQSRGVEESLLSARVPYVVLGGVNFYERREVRDLLAYLRVAQGVGKFADVKRSINTPFRFLGKAFVDGLEDFVTEGDGLIDSVESYVETASIQERQRGSAMSWCKLVRRASQVVARGVVAASATRDRPEEVAAKPSTILSGLVMDLKYNEWLTRDEGAESPENNRVSNVRELIRAAERFPTVAELLAYVDDTIKRAEVAKLESKNSDVVTLCSIHRAKGLEWPVVYVIGCNDKILPHAYAEDVAEERRLFYVACTRAADVLQLSYVAKAAVSNRVLDLKPSLFLSEAGLISIKGGEAVDAQQSEGELVK